ncbi:chromosome partitioning protein ParB [Erysipelothrix larvae]|uniref:Chromosome partitioning protein ParB n=1 Tax=Erysipelothrix larvae TaxID=1514105 RepID=A0A0X8H1S7_9FIRM|nr:ParB/RepB/Spo0J family partition protein [Erysipelothrix larvae]AMC94542.1 chromosome partitioning protein ParB [Erysipelothrix larvae]
MSDRNRLGKGLGAIFGDDVSSVLEEIQTGSHDEYGGVKTSLKVNTIRVNPYQPRRHFDDAKLQELADSIKEHGLFTPILVRESNKGYELIAGERRLRASKLAGLKEISAIVVGFDDQQMMEIALVENVQREDLSVIDEAHGYQLLMERLNLTQDEVAKRVHKSRSHIANLLRLLKLPESVQMMVNQGDLTMGQVRPLITLDDSKEIERLAKEIKKGDLSARQVEKLVKQPEKPTPKKDDNTKHYAYAKTLFEKKLQTRVNIDKNTVSIRFEDDEDLNRILETLNLIEH